MCCLPAPGQGYEPASLSGGGNSDSFSCSVAGRAWSRRGFQARLWRVVRLLLRIDKLLLNASLATEILPLETLGGPARPELKMTMELTACF